MRLLLNKRQGRTWINLKVVPGARKPRVAGLHGDRLKLAVSAPPERGKANDAVLELLRDFFSLQKHQIEIVQGEFQPLKTVAVDMTPDSILQCLRKRGVAPDTGDAS